MVPQTRIAVNPSRPARETHRLTRPTLLTRQTSGN
jgi:hypothetical protein